MTSAWAGTGVEDRKSPPHPQGKQAALRGAGGGGEQWPLPLVCLQGSIQKRGWPKARGTCPPRNGPTGSQKRLSACLSFWDQVTGVMVCFQPVLVFSLGQPQELGAFLP